MKEKKVEKTTRTKLAELEAERLKLQQASSTARKAIARHERELVTEEGNLAVAQATSETGGWLDRRELRKAEKAVADVRAKLDAARVQAKEAEAALDPIEDSIIELQVGAHGPEIRQAAKKVAELKALLREQQDAALATARQMAALYKAAAAKIPRRLVSMRSEKFLKVEIRNPVISALHHGDFASAERRRAINEYATEAVAKIQQEMLFMGPKDREDAENKIAAIRNKRLAELEKEDRNCEPVYLHFEFFKARDGEKKGKWKIVPGQDMAPGRIERVYENGPLPEEIAAIKDIELGRLTKLNGRAASDLEKVELSFPFIEGMVTKDELQNAMRSIEEGA
jgi:hypothetical protein